MRIHNDGLPASLDNYITKYPEPSDYEFECESCRKLFHENMALCPVCEDGEVTDRPKK